MSTRRGDKKVLATEVRKLEVTLTEEQRIKAGKELAETLEAIEVQELSLKEVKSRFKQKIEGLAVDVNRLTGIVNHGVERRDVSCEWAHYPGEEQKHLIRKDSGEVVESMPVSDEELQMNLDK